MPFSRLSNFTQIVFTLIISLFSFFLTMFLAFLLSKVIWDIDFSSLDFVLTDYTNLNHLQVIKLFQIAQSFGLFVAGAIISAILIYPGNGMKYLLANKFGTYESIGFAILLILFLTPVINALGELNQLMNLPKFLQPLQDWMMAMEENAAHLTEAFLKINSRWDFLINVVMIAVLPAVGEELLFRGLFQRQLSQIFKNAHWGILISAFFFSAMHLQFYGFLPRFLLGAVFGYLVWWSGSIWPAIAAHFINNFSAVVAYTVLNDPDKIKKVEEFGTPGNGFIFLIISLLVCGYIIYQFRRKSVPRPY